MHVVGLIEDKAAYAVAEALASRCAFAFADDPDTEVGKVVAAEDAPGTWIFYVYVMSTTRTSRFIERCNVVMASAAGGVEVRGPDEKAIATALKEPIL